MKIIIRLLCSIACFAVVSLTVFAEAPHSGKDLYLYGNSSAALGRGGTGVSGYGADLFSLNPATASSMERISASIQYGTLTSSYYNPEATLLVPTSYGVFGGSFRMIDMNKTALDIKKGYLFTLGAGKDFTDKLSFGATVNFLFANQSAGNNFYLGATIGTLYDTKYETVFGNGFGIFDPRFGLSVNAGIPVGKKSENANLNQPTAGYSLGFFRNDLVKIAFYNDISAFDMYKKFSVKGGLESVFKDTYVARIGTSVPQKYEYGDFTAGLGYRMRQRSFSTEINYALVHYSKSTFVHYLGVTAEFGELDRTPPTTAIKSTELYISPNHDGVQDYTLIALDVKDQSKIKGWQLQVLDSKGSVVREFKAPDRDIIQSLTFSGFFTRLVSPRESAVVPENVMWDGTDAAGNTVADGKYSYAFMAWDERDNYAEKKYGDIFVDKTPPSVVLKNDDSLFSPNGDGKKDEFIITQKVTASPEDEWNAAFYNAEGKAVKSYKWTGIAVPAQVKWNGKDDSGNDAPEGLYRYQISSRDKAGNFEKQEIPEISLTRKFESSDIFISREYFSFKNGNSLMFRPTISSKDGMTAWVLSIENEDKKPVRQIRGEGAFPDRIEWDVKDEKGKPLSDGKYLYSMKATFKSGNEPESFRKQFTVDSTPPSVDLSFSPDLFSPDGDGENDILTLSPEGKDTFGIAEWSITIFNASNFPFKKFTGKGELPKEIKWDGLSDKGELVESATDYTMILSATDRAGNQSGTPKITLPVDVLVIVTERGLKIRISNIQFGFDSAKLLPTGTKVLNRVGQLLDRYGKYRVLIEGHTDDIGEESYNLKLSEQRAQAVLDYLASKGGVNKERLRARGMGETTPFVPNKDDESRRKNRRVEFLLEKSDKAETK